MDLPITGNISRSPGRTTTGSLAVPQRTAGLRQMTDVVTLRPAATGSPQSRPMVASVPTLGLSAASAPAAAATSSILQSLERSGFHLLYKRRFWIPLLMNHYAPLTSPDFEIRMGQHSSRLAVASTDLAPVPVRDGGDVAALNAFYLGGAIAGVSQPQLCASLGTLYQGGYSFSLGNKKGFKNIGPYGAWRFIQDGGSKTLIGHTHGKPDASLRTAEDAFRTQFFHLNNVPPGLAHTPEAETLKALHLQKAVLYADADGQKTLGAEHAYAEMFQTEKLASLWAGPKDLPLVSFTPGDLKDSTACLNRYQTACQQAERMLNSGVPHDWQFKSWERLQKPMAGESFDERLNWLRDLTAACDKDTQEALEHMDFLESSKRPQDSIAATVKDFAEVRQATPRTGWQEAQNAYLLLRDDLDKTLPGPQPPDDKKQLFLQILTAVQEAKRVGEVWNMLDGPEDKKAQLSVFLDLHALEDHSTPAACHDYKVIRSVQRKGESLADAANAFKLVRSLTPKADSGDSVQAFKFLREDLAASLPGTWKDSDRERMFLDLLGREGSFKATSPDWTFLAGDSPAAEFPERLQNFEKLLKLEQADSQAARGDFSLALDYRLPNESVTDAVGSFLDVRQRLAKYASDEAREAFRFLRSSDIDSSLQGPWSTDEKRAMYLKALSTTSSNKLTLKYWSKLAGSGPAPADFPQRLDVFLGLCRLENFDYANAWSDYELIVAHKGPDPIDAVGSRFTELRQKMGDHGAKGARKAFIFMQDKLDASLPGPWSRTEKEAMFGRLLEGAQDFDLAIQLLHHMTGVTTIHRTPTMPADFPDVLDACVELARTERLVEPTEKALDALCQAAAAEPRTAGAKSPLPALVAEYLLVRTALAEYNQGDAVPLFNFYHSHLTPAERPLYLQVQKAIGSFEMARAAWDEASDDAARQAERVKLMVDCLSKEQYVSAGLDEFRSVKNHLRPGETCAHAGQVMDEIRKALPEGFSQGGYANDRAEAFRFMRIHTTDGQEPEFLTMLRKSEVFGLPANTLESLEKIKGQATMDQMLDKIASHPPDCWPGMVVRMSRIETIIPPGLDRKRAGAALFRTVAIPDRSIEHMILSRLDRTPAKDRISALEWLCGVAAAADSVEGFQQAWQDVHRPSAPGSVEERQALLVGLLRYSLKSPNGFDCSLDLLRRLDRVPPAEFSNAGSQAVALMAALQGHAADALRAMEYVLDARAQGKFSNESLDQVLSRFATLYVGGGSLESALARLEQGPAPSSGPGKIEQQDGDIIIGGVRVPRPKKYQARPPHQKYHEWRYEKMEHWTPWKKKPSEGAAVSHQPSAVSALFDRLRHRLIADAD